MGDGAAALDGAAQLGDDLANILGLGAVAAQGAAQAGNGAAQAVNGAGRGLTAAMRSRLTATVALVRTRRWHVGFIVNEDNFSTRGLKSNQVGAVLWH